MSTWCLLVLLAALCLSEGHGLDVGKMFLSKGKPNPMVMNMIVGAQLQQKLDKVLSSVRNGTCLDHLRWYKSALENSEYWALNMLDSTSRVDGVLAALRWHMGNYDQCMRVQDVRTDKGSFSAQYCSVRICPSSVPFCLDDPNTAAMIMIPYLKDLEDHKTGVLEFIPIVKQSLNHVLFRVAVCLPSTCSPADVQVLIQSAIHQITDQVQVNVEPRECYTNQPDELSRLDYFTLAFFTSVLGVIVWSTVYDLTHKEGANRNEKYLAFSAYSNFKKIVSMTKSSDQGLSLQCLHGIRCLSILHVILGHVYLEGSLIPTYNIITGQAFLQSWYAIWVLSGSFTVDTFFVISGLLLAYVFLNLTNETKKMNLVVFYLHRFIRLTPALAAVLLLDMSLAKKVGSGPIWRTIFQGDCSATWWSVLFYIKNYSGGKTCMNHTWYVASDTQMYCLSPLLLLPLWKTPRRGRQLLLAALLFSWIIPFLKAYIWQIRVPFTVGANFNEGPSANLYRGTENRYGPWIIGLWLGQTLYRLKTGKLTIRMSKTMLVMSWVYIAIAIGGCAISLHHFSQLTRAYHRFLDSFYNSVVRLLWGSGIALLIFNCATGRGGIINRFLSLGSWIPWSRLTYSVYLIHMIVIYLVVAGIRSPKNFQNEIMILKFVTVSALSILAAVVLSLMFEAPLINLERALLKKEREKVKPKSVAESPNNYEKKVMNEVANGYILLKTEE